MLEENALKTKDAASERARSPQDAEEPFLGNITNTTPLPADYEGPPKRGHLQFEACFEGGEKNFGCQ